MVDISKDYLYLDNAATGVYTTVEGVSYPLNYIMVTVAIDSPDTFDETGLPTIATSFSIWQDELPNAPQVNAKLVVGTESYRIISYSRMTLLSRWLVTAIIDAGTGIS
jgi:hypothetical protein